MASVQVQFSPNSLILVETNHPAYKVVNLGTVIMAVLAFDDTTQEYANGTFEIPNGLDSSGTVTFRAHISPATGASSKNIALNFDHRSIDDTETINGSYSTKASGDKAITATTGNQTTIEWTETVSNLGWTAEDNCYFRISRDPGAGSDLTGDLYLIGLTVELPVT